MVERQGHRRRAASARKDTWIKEQDTSLSNDSYVAEHARDAGVPRPHDRVHEGAAREDRRRSRAADIERVAKKYLDPKRLVIVDAGDVAKQSSPASATCPR